MGPMDQHGMHHMEGGMGWMMAPMMGGFLIVVLAVVAFVAWQLWRRRHHLRALWRQTPNRLPAEHRAREILAERFARGEIDSQEFMERASMLNWTPGLEPRPQRR